MSRCRFTHLTRSGGGHAVRTFLYWFHCHFGRETWVQQVCKTETNLAQPRSSRGNVNPLLGCQDRFWMHNVRQCLGSWTCVVLGNLLWIIPSFKNFSNSNLKVGWCRYEKNRQGPVKLSPKLYQRVRWRMFSLGSVPSPHSFQEQAWRILYQISLVTRASFEACKRILSGEFHTLEVYALYRLATHIEEPGKSRAKSLIGKALLYFATSTKQFAIAHSVFGTWQLSSESWDLDSRFGSSFYSINMVAIPLFLPTHRLRKQGFPKLGEILHNHRKMERRWKMSHIQNLPRCCKELWSIARQHIQKTGHVAINLDDVNLPSKLHIFANANANSTYFHVFPFPFTIFK